MRKHIFLAPWCWACLVFVCLVLVGARVGSVSGGTCRVVRGRAARVRIATIGGVPVVVDERGRVRVLATVAVPVAYPLGGYSVVTSGYAPTASSVLPAASVLPERGGAGEVGSRGTERVRGDTKDDKPRWAAVLRQRCAKCHSGENEAGSTLFESDGATLAESLDDESVLYQIVTDKMPKGGSLSVEEKAILVAWLRKRAQEGE